jgi:eukaryotic-like serine/threonine-protein kinase
VVATHGPADALGLVGSTIDQVRFDLCADAGGFGLIYKGFHEGLGEAVAIKCLRIASIQKTNEAIREALAGRFRDETKLLYRLSQGNLDIVRCISSGTLVAPRTKEYTPYMVLEWLDGRTLSTELKDRRDRKLEPRNLEQAVKLLDSAVGGIAYAHSHDVVHRDVKPGNLFLTNTREGVRMKVLDFGLAKILSDEAIGIRPSVETGVGVHFCSPSYGAPEQFSGQIGKIGPWTDVYSLTLVLYEILLGHKVRPAGNLAEGLLKAIDPATCSPSATELGLKVPRAVEELLKKSVSQNPRDRPHDAGVFWTLLKEAMTAKGGDYAATVADDGMGSSMQQIRDEAVLRAAQHSSPFAGTMLMQNAPSGAPHLVTHHPSAPLPAAGRPPTPVNALAPTPLAAVGVTTAPLAAPLHAAAAAAAVENANARAEQQLRMQMTMPLGATSPLAASMAIPSPLQNAPGYGAGAPQPPPSPNAGSYPPEGGPPRSAVRTDPRMGRLLPETPRRNGALVAIAAASLAVLIAFVVYWFVLRHR